MKFDFNLLLCFFFLVLNEVNIGEVKIYFLTLFLHFCFYYRQRSKKKKRKYGQNNVAKKMVTDESSLGMVTSTSGHLVPLDDELKENNQSDMNSLDNSPSSTTSSKKLNASPVAIPFQMATVHALRTSLEMCDSVQTPGQEVCETMRVDLVTEVTVPSTCDSTTDICAVTSTTDVQEKEKDLPSLKRRKKRRKGSGVTSSVDVSSSSGTKVNGNLVYNGAYQVIKMCGEGGPCSSETEVNVEDEAQLIDVTKSLARTSESSKTDESTGTSTNCESRKLEMGPSGSGTASNPSDESSKFPDSFEELIVMHFKQELDVAEMIESMSCLERDNEATETQLSRLVSQIDLLQNVTRELDDASFK